MNILFVCHPNINRSKTFETYFSNNYPQYKYRSAGCWYGNPYVVDNENLNWADLVFCMDMVQYKHIDEKFPKYANKVHIIAIPDNYDYGAPGLIELIKYWVENFGGKWF